MAWLVSFSFSIPLRRPSEIESKLKLNYFSSPCKVRRAVFRNAPNLSSLANKKSVELTSLSHANRSVCNMTTLGYGQDMLVSRRCLPGCASCIFIVDQNVQTIISGYWSGPDIEDGWGFVEAYVDQTRQSK